MQEEVLMCLYRAIARLEAPHLRDSMTVNAALGELKAACESIQSSFKEKK